MPLFSRIFDPRIFHLFLLTPALPITASTPDERQTLLYDVIERRGHPTDLPLRHTTAEDGPPRQGAASAPVEDPVVHGVDVSIPYVGDGDPIAAGGGGVDSKVHFR